MSAIIELLEREKLASIKDIDITDDRDITIKDVKTWFFETEKVIRVTANLSLEATSQQAVNQLRYAAHHVLKSKKNNDADIVEAYKHCKRAYYDTLDLFILTLNDRFNNSLVYVKSSKKQAEISTKLKNILISIQNARFKYKARIDYYNAVQSNLIDGLKLLEYLSLSVNLKINNSEYDIKKEKVVIENKKLRSLVEKQKEQLNSELQIASKKTGMFGIMLAVIIVLTTSIGMLFQGFFTEHIEILKKLLLKILP